MTTFLKLNDIDSASVPLNGPLHVDPFPGCSGAALDVVCTEPLPKEHPLWDMENVLLSPHNADCTATFLHDSIRLFVRSVRGFLAGEEMPCHRIDLKAGY